MNRTPTFPTAYEEEMRALLGEAEYGSYLSAFSEKSEAGLRANTLKVSADDLAGLLDLSPDYVPWERNGLYVDPERKLSASPYYYAGLYYLQEPSAMAPAASLPVAPGERVLDLCAAPGGKSTALAAKLAGSGFLLANDISASRCKALIRNLEMAGVRNAAVTCEEPRVLAERFPAFFDKILVDAPCSGEGMFRREHRMIAAWEEHGPSFFAPVQRQILDAAAKMLRPGGMLLFSTCTFSALENEGSAEALLAAHPDMEMIDLPEIDGWQPGTAFAKARRMYPHHIRGEGHFLALFKKADDEAALTPARPARKGGVQKSGKLPSELIEAIEEYGLADERARVRLYGEKAVLLPGDEVPFDSLRVLRSGLLLGTCRKGRFEPSQALAMALTPEEAPRILSLSKDDERVLRYLRGETLELSQEETGGRKGFFLVCIGEFPLGWGKADGTRLKNKYLPGWRMMS